MSLISDGLKKAQQEREKFRDEQELPGPIKGTRLYDNKRLIFYGTVVVVIIAAIIAVTVIFNPKEQGQMKALHLQQNSPEAAVERKTPEFPAKQDMSDARLEARLNNEKSPGEMKPSGIGNFSKAAEEEYREEKRPAKKRDVVKEKASMKEKVIDKGNSSKKEKRIAATKTKKPSEIPKIEKIEKLPEKQETKGSAGDVSVDRLVEQGDGFAAEKEYFSAVEKYKAALKKEKTPALYLKLYGVYREMNNRVLARAYIEEGLKEFPEDFYLNKTGAVIYIRAKEFEKALNRVKKAIELNPEDYSIYTYQGLCYFHKGDYDEALVHLQQSLDLNSDAVENYYYIGLIFDNRKEYRKALEYYNVFYKLNPDNKNFKHREWIIRRMRTLEEYLNNK